MDEEPKVDVRRIFELASDACYYGRRNLRKAVESGAFPKEILEKLVGIAKEAEGLKSIKSDEDRILAARLLHQHLEFLVAAMRDAELELRKKHMDAQEHTAAMIALLNSHR